MVVELCFTQLSHGQYGEAPHRRGAVPAVQFTPGQRQSGIEAGLRQSGQLCDGLVQTQFAAEVVESEPYELFDAIASQAVELVFDIKGFPDGRVHFLPHLYAGFGDPGEVHPDQAVQQLGPVHEEVRQKSAVGEQIDEQARGLGVLRQQGEKAGAGTDAAAELGHVVQGLLRLPRVAVSSSSEPA